MNSEPTYFQNFPFYPLIMMKLLVKQQQLCQNAKGILGKFWLVKFHYFLSSSKLSLKMKDSSFSLLIHQYQSALLYTLHYRMVYPLCKFIKNPHQKLESNHKDLRFDPDLFNFNKNLTN